MRNLILTIVIISSIVSCNSKNENEPINYNIDTKIDILVKNSEGIDLLNPSNEYLFNLNNLKVYYILNGENKQTDFKILNLQEGINGATAKYSLRMFPNNYASNDVITYIKWNDIDIDTLKTNYKSGKNSVICSKVLYNNKVVYDPATGIYGTSQFGDRTIEITK